MHKQLQDPHNQEVHPFEHEEHLQLLDVKQLRQQLIVDIVASFFLVIPFYFVLAPISFLKHHN
ncbi:hypothetical protein THRCLA_22111 [Thraustotheca clavata]|uniref:Uncharacterized protein n=1 Tax=Thraustotheca clavata TaxID=74557 RepID=A0A1V9ZC63_9STRA|nr:hypothetical protein THRCLA_22111 [Thraustotheca clavata]